MTRITLPFVKMMITSPDKKFSDFDITDYEMSEFGLEVIHQRDEFRGVMVDISFGLSFCKEGADFIKNLYEKDGMRAKADIEVYHRDDLDNIYTLVTKMKLDFADYKEYDNKVEISCINGEFNEYLNSYGNTKYDIEVSKLNPQKWNYNRIKMLNKGSYTIPESEFTVNMDRNYGLSISLSSAEVTPGTAEHDFRSQTMGELKTDNDSKVYFFEAAEEVRLSISLKTTITISRVDPYIDKTSKSMVFAYYDPKTNSFDPVVLVQMLVTYSESKYDGQNYTNIRRAIISDKFERTIPAGMRLSLFLVDAKNGDKVTISDFNELSLTYLVEGDPLTGKKGIDVIRPEALFQKFLDLMTEEPGYFSAEFHWRSDPFIIRICAAESMRNIKNACLHGSPRDFIDWMSVLGYEFEVKNRVISFKERDEFFLSSPVVELAENDVADLILMADDEYTYTHVEVGYETPDYESTNGRFEANGIFEYKTDFISRQRKELKLISPYRADSIGLELLAWERTKQTTDNKSDNDIFFVALVSSTMTEYKGYTIKDQESGVELFNAPFLPNFLVGHNESKIGVGISKLTFASTDMSSSASLSNGKKIYGDIDIPEGLFSPEKYNFATGYNKGLPAENKRNGLVHFTYQGVNRKGYIEEIRQNYSRPTETTWILKAKK